MSLICSMSPPPDSWWRGFTAPGLEAPPAAAPAPPAFPTSGREEAQTPVCTTQAQTPVTNSSSWGRNALQMHSLGSSCSRGTAGEAQLPAECSISSEQHQPGHCLPIAQVTRDSRSSAGMGCRRSPWGDAPCPVPQWHLSWALPSSGWRSWAASACE